MEIESEEFIVLFHCKDSYRGLYSHICKYKLIICYTISWSCDLSFTEIVCTYVTNQLCGSSTWLQSPTREGCWLQSSSVHPHDEDQENTWSQNPMVHIHSNFFKKDELGQNFVSGHNLLEQTFLKACTTCELFDGP